MQTDFLRQLIEDHGRIRAIIDALDNASESDTEERKRGVQSLRKELVPHFRGEEQTLYPVLAQGGADFASLAKVHEDHRVAELFLDEISEPHIKWDVFTAKLRALREFIEFHFEEEENLVFSEVRPLLMDQDENETTARLLTVKRHALGALC